MASFSDHKEFALQMDAQDPLSKFADYFYKPFHGDRQALYFCGNSLGLLSKQSETAINHLINDWKNYGVKGHFEGENRWFDYHKKAVNGLAHLTGAKKHEVVPMGTLSANLHFLLASFYQPTPERYKIIMEGGAFPSDQYIVESQVAYNALKLGNSFNANDAIIEVMPDMQDGTWSMEHILKMIEVCQKETALILFSGVHYLTGQLFDLKAIADTAKKFGIVVGFDLAHAVGNVPLKLHDWGVDFAAWCHYKYVNSGPGALAGIFVHEKHSLNTNTFRLAGWWGYDAETRFLMQKGFKAQKGAEGWMLSNENMLSMASLIGALQIFEEATIERIREKSILLTDYLQFLLSQFPELKIITPKSRGAQLSVRILNGKGRSFFEAISAEGVICDWREPDVIRLSPAPLFNSFEEVYDVAQIVAKALINISKS
jgi:kynureninase